MIKIDEITRKQLLDCYKDNEVMLEGHILKLIESTGDQEFDSYIKVAIEKDADTRRKRIDVNKDVQKQNTQLRKSEAENEEIKKRLRDALTTAEQAKNLALNDLEELQKRSQVELISTIVRVSLWIVCSIGVITTVLFGISLFTGVDNKIIESAWSNMFGILLTNSFSIIGTIMGVKYASNKKDKCKCEESD
jgi:hypothetical protein